MCEEVRKASQETPVGEERDLHALLEPAAMTSMQLQQEPQFISYRSFWTCPPHGWVSISSPPPTLERGEDGWRKGAHP